MTPREFRARCRAHRVQIRAEWHRTAWMTANLMNIHLAKKDRITPERLLGWTKVRRSFKAGVSSNA